MIKTPPAMALLEKLVSKRKSSLSGLTFKMFYLFLKLSLLQSMLVSLLTLLLSGHNCQTTQKFIRQSNWTPVVLGQARLLPQLDSLSSDGAKSTPEFAINTATTGSPPNTVSKDIQKLLEDYVTYLSTMPDFQKESRVAKTSKSQSNQDEIKSFKFSTPQTFTLMSPMIPASSRSSNDMTVATSSSLKSVDNSELQGSASTVISPVIENNALQLGSNYYLEMPTESGLTLNLSDEELSTFIDNVLSHAPGKSFNSTNTTSTVAIPLNEFEENATVSLPENSNTPASVPIDKSSIFSLNVTEETKKVNGNTQIEVNDIRQATVTTELPFFRLEMFENSEENVDTSSEDNINLVSKETATDFKKIEEHFYTSEGEVVTETSNTDNLSQNNSEGAKKSSSRNETFSSEDETSSNNFSRQLIPAEDAKLVHELKQNKDLLRIQIDKLQLLENSEQSDVLESRQTTTTELPETTSTEMVAIERGLKNANDTDLENFIVNTELPPVTKSPRFLEEATTLSADESESTTATTVVDSTPIDSTTEALNEFNEAISSTALSSRNGITDSTANPDSLSINETLALRNYLRASVEEKAIPSSTTEAAKAPNRSRVEITVTTASTAKLLNNPLRTTVEDLRASTSKRKSNVVWNTKPIGKISSGQSRQFATNGANYNDDALQGRGANQAENSSLPITTLDLMVGENAAAATFNASADKDNGNETDSETMILTHVPKITIIHKIMKPSGSSGSVKNQQTEEEAYREALRKHKDLIKTAMSSISLVPAAFKRYKINNKNKVNIGEIYLLPNFAGSTARIRSGLRVLPQSSKASFDRQFIHEFGKVNTAVTTQKIVEQQKPIFIRHVKTNTLPKFAYSQLGNKFNTEASGYQPISAPVEKKLLPHQGLQNDRAKLYVSYLNSIVAKNQNPENILKLYRPNFIHRKRFKKVRIPSGYRIKKKEIPLTAFVTARNGTFERENQVLTWLDASPILITVAQSSEQQNRTFLPHAQALVSASVREPAPLSRSSLSSATTTTSGQWLQRVNMSTSSRRTIDKSRFKVFCTYDAHRSLSAPTNDSRGRFFDIHQLEQNAAILEQCTHLVYAFASINMNGEVLPGAPVTRNDGNGVRPNNDTISTSALQHIKALKERFPHLRVLVAVGGWSTPPQLFSLLVATSKLRDRLCQNVHRFVLHYDFDGAILAWFYPVYGSKSASESSQRSPRSTSGQTLFQLDDKQNLVKFMRALRNRFDSIPHKSLEIGLMSPPFEEQIDRGYDVPKLSNLVDHLILLTFDYYGSWNDKVHHFAPLYPPTRGLLTERDSKLNINYTLSYWLNKQAPRDKTVLGLAFFGRSFTLENPSVAEPGAKAIGPGIAGPVTNKPGLLAFNELCDLYLGHPAVKLNEDEHRITAHLQVFDQFVGFDDELSLYLKTKYAISNHLSGVFIWSINQDDYRNRCGWGRFPLLKAINKAIEHCKNSAVPCKI